MHMAETSLTGFGIGNGRGIPASLWGDDGGQSRDPEAGAP
jgi:hypothetical protein